MEIDKDDFERFKINKGNVVILYLFKWDRKLKWVIF